jgi:hypothetical protein
MEECNLAGNEVIYNMNKQYHELLLESPFMRGYIKPY